MHQMIVSKAKSARQLSCTDVPQEEVLSVIIECNALSLKFARFDMKKGESQNIYYPLIYPLFETSF